MRGRGGGRVVGLVCACMLAIASPALAGPTLRAGLTVALRDDTTPGANMVGPIAGLGWRFGALMAEVDYAYLSFQDSAALGGGVHRLGALARLDVLRTRTRHGEAYGLYAEAGVGERLGRWQIDATHDAPDSGHQPEAHIGLGFQIDNGRRGRGYGWLLGLRLAAAPHDPSFDAICRGSCPTSSTGSDRDTDLSVLFEASVLIGR